MDTPLIPKMPESTAPVQSTEWGEPNRAQVRTTHTPMWAIVATFVVIAAIGTGIYMFTRPKPTPTPNQTETSAPTLTPTPVRSASPVATTSAFLSLEREVTALSASIAATSADDPTLTPPIVELDLGLTPR